MDKKPQADNAQPNTAALVPDVVMAPRIGVSVGWLRKDRVTSRVIPFIRLGDRCLYDPPAVLDAVRAMTVGGNSPSSDRMRRRPRGQR